MRPTRFYSTYRPPRVSQPHGAGYGGGYILIAVLSLISIVIAAAGVRSLMEQPFLICAIFAAIVYAAKMFVIRPKIRYGEMMSVNWDEMVFYLIIAFIFVTLAAFGLYCLNVEASAATVDQASTDTVKRFIRDTVAMNTYAMSCWFLPAVLELLIVLLVFHNRSRYEYWD